MLFGKTKNAVYFNKIKKLLHSAKNDTELYRAIVNAPFHNKLRAVQLDLGIVVLLLVNEQTKMIDRIALSDTELAAGAISVSAKPFHSIKIPLSSKTNIIADAIRSNDFRQTGDWKYLFTPALTAEEARFNQAGAAIGCSVVSPLIDTSKKGALIFSFFQHPENISVAHYNFIAQYSSAVAQALSLAMPAVS